MNKFTWNLPAAADSLGLLRETLRSCLAEREVRQEDIENVEMIVGEACANVVRHAYTSTSQTYRVTLGFKPGRLALEVIDHGVGFDCCDPRSRCLDNSCGMGLFIIQQLAQRVDIISKAGFGTSLKIEYDLRRRKQGS